MQPPSSCPSADTRRGGSQPCLPPAAPGATDPCNNSPSQLLLPGRGAAAVPRSRGLHAPAPALEPPSRSWCWLQVRASSFPLGLLPFDFCPGKINLSPAGRLTAGSRRASRSKPFPRCSCRSPPGPLRCQPAARAPAAGCNAVLRGAARGYGIAGNPVQHPLTRICLRPSARGLQQRLLQLPLPRSASLGRSPAAPQPLRSGQALSAAGQQDRQETQCQLPAPSYSSINSTPAR